MMIQAINTFESIFDSWNSVLTQWNWNRLDKPYFIRISRLTAHMHLIHTDRHNIVWFIHFYIFDFANTSNIWPRDDFIRNINSFLNHLNFMQGKSRNHFIFNHLRLLLGAHWFACGGWIGLGNNLQWSAAAAISLPSPLSLTLTHYI